MVVYTKETFKEEFEKYDTKNIYTKEEVERLYDYLVEVYRVVTDENFEVCYCIDNKELVDGWQ